MLSSRAFREKDDALKLAASASAISRADEFADFKKCRHADDITVASAALYRASRCTSTIQWPRRASLQFTTGRTSAPRLITSAPI